MDVPSKLPKILADVSAITALLRPSISPVSRRFPAGSAMAVNVPVVSKKSTKNITNTTDRKAVVVRAEKSRANRAPAAGGAEKTPPKGARPLTQPIALKTMMLMRMLPLMPRADRPAIIIRPIIDRISSGLFKAPRPTMVSGLSITMPADIRPIRPKNRPIPAVIAICISPGMDRIRYERSLLAEKMKNSTDETKTAASACCQLRP